MDALTFSRLQFGDTAAFHILWPVMSIGLALYMVIMEALWLWSGDERYYQQLRFWTKIFVLTFAIGTASGLPLAFQFGTNWSQFAKMAGDFLGNILGFETTIAFALESAFLAIVVFGWQRVPRKIHLFATCMVLLGASISAFWIMVANSWMQVPEGVAMSGGLMVVTDYMRAIFNADTFVSFTHMLIACIESTLFLVGGIAAMRLLTSDEPRVRTFFRDALIYSMGITCAIAPLQIIIGDVSGLVVASHQPEKLAAIELHWNTNQPGTSAPWNILAWPNVSNDGNSFAVAIPGSLSLITTHTLNGTVHGLTDFPADARPTPLEATMVFYAFRLMVLIGTLLAALTLWSAWLWYRGELSLERIGSHRTLLRMWALATPLGFIATESGWMVREIGRQPWTVYHLLRTSDSLSVGLNAPEVAATTSVVTAVYVLFGAMFIYFVYRIVVTGPDFSAPIV